jgi:two-component system phosphate regulon sensor histidine kinase PhoR
MLRAERKRDVSRTVGTQEDRMWSSRLFWKLLISYVALILGATVVFSGLMSAYQREQAIAHLEERMRDEAKLVRSNVEDWLATSNNVALRDYAIRLSRETQTRITVVAPDGKVLADSDQLPELMENHRNRPEIDKAARDGTGVGNHVSRTLGIPMMYLALRVDKDQQAIGFVRVALPAAHVEQRVATVQRYVWGIGLAVCTATTLITWIVVASLTRPMKLLTTAAQAIAQGDYGHRVRVTGGDEIGALANTFNRMSSDLNERVSQIRADGELLTTILTVMVEGVVALDANQRVLFANDAARSMLGLGNQNLAGRPLWEMVRSSAVLDGLQEACNGSNAWRRSEFELTGRDRKTVAMHANRLPGDPSPGIVLVCHDITELRRLENLRREFVANVSHELKTPLASIKAYVETLLGGAVHDSENNIPFLRRIDEQADRLTRLILDLLRLARVESGQEVFEFTAVPLDEVVRACVIEHDAASKAKRIQIETVAPEKSVSVRVDPEGLRTILDNLIDNAIKYTPEQGSVVIRWSADDSFATVEVQDSGIGIAPHDQPRIFERFYRVDKARSRDLGGTGLGLSIVKHLTQAFGGSVSVASQVGSGSTFTVRLPIA